MLQTFECGQQHICPLPDHREGLLDLCHDLCRIQLSHVRNIPYLDRLPDRVEPILAEAIVLTLHEHKDVACPDERRGRRSEPHAAGYSVACYGRSGSQ